MSLRPSARTEVRRSKYNVAVDAKEGRRRREDNMEKIQKNRREENLMKKRHERIQNQQLQPTVIEPRLDKKLESLSAMVAGIWPNDRALQLEATTQAQRNPPIDEVIQSGVVPRFMSFLQEKTTHSFSLQEQSRTNTTTNLNMMK